MDAVEVKRKDTNGFSKQYCDVCKRETWHYKDRTTSLKTILPHCTEHESAYLKHAQQLIRDHANYVPVHVTPAPVEDTPEQAERVKALEAKWKAGNEGKIKNVFFHKRKFNAEFTESVFGKKEDKPTTPVCSYCGKDIDLITATEGRGPLRVLTIQEVTPNDEIIEKKVVKQQKILACPDCVGNLQPTVDKDGKITKQAFVASSRI